jgi:hypothetical protein
MEGDGVEGSDSVTAGGSFLQLLFNSCAGDTGDIGAVQCGTVYTLFRQASGSAQCDTACCVIHP